MLQHQQANRALHVMKKQKLKLPVQVGSLDLLRTCSHHRQHQK
jgi:hypothetical protein